VSWKKGGANRLEQREEIYQKEKVASSESCGGGSWEKGGSQMGDTVELLGK